MFPLGAIREVVEAFAGGFDAALLSGADAEAAVADAAAIENMASVIKAMAGGRAAECGTWRSQGDRSPAHQLARLTGVFVSRARDLLATAGRLKSLLAVDGAARRGELSMSQLVPLADAADAAPDAEGRLLELARTSSVGELADECARTKAAAKPSDDERQKAIRDSRYLRRRRCADGAGELRYRSTLEEVAQIFAVAQGSPPSASTRPGLPVPKSRRRRTWPTGCVMPCWPGPARRRRPNPWDPSTARR